MPAPLVLLIKENRGGLEKGAYADYLMRKEIKPNSLASTPYYWKYTKIDDFPKIAVDNLKEKNHLKLKYLAIKELMLKNVLREDDKGHLTKNPKGIPCDHCLHKPSPNKPHKDAP